MPFGTGKPLRTSRQQVYIVEDPTVNAYVDQSNVITVHSGLLHYAASDEEIAAVLAHEYGHVFADHIAKSIQNAELGAAGAFLVSVLGEFNEMDDDEVEELAQDVYVLGATANSPQYELEADYYMALILENAGIDLEHGKALLVRLARAGSDSVTREQSGWGVSARLMATTHPADGPRSMDRHFKRDGVESHGSACR